jgi:hypothetical protein
MKKTLIFLFSVFTFCASAQWQVLGQRNFSPGGAGSISIEVNNAGVPYVAFQDFSNGGKASVMKFDGTNWVYVGAPDFTSASANHLHFTISSTDTLYVAYSNGPDTMLYAQKFDGISWQQVGSPVMKSMFADITVDYHNVPHVVGVTGQDNYGNADTIFVKKFVGGIWTNVGDTFPTVAASVPEIEIDTAGFIYLAASSRSLSYGTEFHVYDNVNWQMTGGLGYREYVRLRSNKGNKVYIVNGTVNAPTYTGAPNLVDFKTGGVLYTFPAQYYLSLDVAIDTSSKAYCLFANPYAPTACGSTCPMMQYVLAGVSTSPITTNFATRGESKMTIDNSTSLLRGTGYIAFADTGSAGSKLTVISCGNPLTTGVNELKHKYESVSAFPNPANYFVNIKSTEEIGLITIYNSLGEIVFQHTISTIQTQLDISKFPAGIYNVKTQTGSVKIIKE